MKEDAQAVVLEAGEPTSGPPDLLRAQVETIGRIVRRSGAVVWIKISVRQRSRVSPSERNSSTSSPLHPTMASSRSIRASFWVVGQMVVAYRLLRTQDAEELVMRIAVV